MNISNGRIRILIADDHVLIRECLVDLLNAQPDMTLVGSAGNGEEAVDLTRILLPEVVLMDITMPVKNGIEATREICRLNGRTKIIGLSMHDHPVMAERMIKAGAVDYLVKTESPDILLERIRKIADVD